MGYPVACLCLQEFSALEEMVTFIIECTWYDDFNIGIILEGCLKAEEVVKMLMGNVKKLNLFIREHLVYSFPLKDGFHILVVPSCINKKFVLLPVEGFHLDKVTTPAAVCRIPIHAPLVCLWPSRCAHVFKEFLSIDPTDF